MDWEDRAFSYKGRILRFFILLTLKIQADQRRENRGEEGT